MPTYDLRCASCDAGFEVFRQGFLRDEDRACPSCGQRAKQLFTGFVAARSSTQMAGVVAGGSAPAPAAPAGGCGHGGCGCGGH
ncbi:MAG: zinc ribbon domain-containing protein [Actinobacteria bacterium]|nr:zinc ribbon domain-containing protein [Actinomycetota bacterium]